MRSTRRDFIKGSALSLGAFALGCASAPAPAPEPEPAPPKGPIAIVPGTGCGIGTYERLTQALEARGRRVFPIALAGMGERVGEIRPDIDANLHAQEVADFLVRENLDGVTLVGHSYGGMPMTGVVGRSDRIAGLVYLDAYVPKNGESVFSIDPAFGDVIQQRADEHGDGWKIPPPPPEQFMKTEADIAWFRAHVTESPLAMYKTPLRVDEAAWSRMPKGYVAFAQFKFFQREGQAIAAAGGKYQLVPAPHMAVYTQPEETADAILAVEG